MSKLRLRAVLCIGGVFVLAVTAMIAIPPTGLKAGEDSHTANKRRVIKSPFVRTRISDSVAKKKAFRRSVKNKIQRVSSKQSTKKQVSVNRANQLKKPSLRQSRRTYVPVRRQKKSFMTKTKDFFASRIPTFRKRNTRNPRNTRYTQPTSKKSLAAKTQPKKPRIRFASASNRKKTASEKNTKIRSSKKQKSEVLTHLEKLYARDGLPMPEMDMKKMAQQKSETEDPTLHNPFAKIANEMSKKNLKSDGKGNSKPIYAGPLNIPSQGKGNPFAALDKKSDRQGNNPFKASQEKTSSQVILVDKKKVSPLRKHMNSLTKPNQINMEKESSVGFQGFCPVILKDMHSKIAVNPKKVSVYEGVLYSFSTEQARKKFLDNPVRYVPVMGGTDMVQLIEHGQTVEGSLQHCCWFRGRLYMFSSEEMLKIFLNHPSQYATDIAK